VIAGPIAAGMRKKMGGGITVPEPIYRLKNSNPGVVLTRDNMELECPRCDGLCGNWCPAFIDTYQYDPGENGNKVPAVSIKCFPQELTFKIGQ
jgi:hypothetical protein